VRQGRHPSFTWVRIGVSSQPLQVRVARKQVGVSVPVRTGVYPCVCMTGFLIEADMGMRKTLGMETPQNPVPEATSTNSQQQTSLKERIDEAWTEDLTKDLGDSQRSRLAKWVQKDLEDKGEDYLTVPVLRGMLEMLIEYYPEEVSRAVPN